MFDLLPADAAAALDAEVRRGARTGRLDLAALTALVAGAGAPAASLRARLDAGLAAAPPAWHAACTAPLVYLVAAGANAEGDVRADGGAPRMLACPDGLGTVAAFGLTYIAHALRRGSADDAVPQVRVHASLAPRAAAARGRRCGEALLAAVAERGLVGRPWHLWLGPALPAWTLEPYLRDLAPQLLAAAGLALPKASAATTLDELPLLHRAATAAACAQPELGAERQRAGEAGGLWTVSLAGLQATLVDLARVGPGHVHPAVGVLPARAPWRHAAQAPLWVCLDWHGRTSWGDVEGEGAAVLTRLLAGLGSAVRRLDLVLPAAHADAAARPRPDALGLTATPHPRPLLRALWVAGRLSALTLPPPPTATLAGVFARLQAKGACPEVAAGFAGPLALPAPWAATLLGGGLDGSAGSLQAAVAVGGGAGLVEAALAARQRGLLPRTAQLGCLVGGRPGCGDGPDKDAGAQPAVTSLAAWSAEAMAESLGVPVCGPARSESRPVAAAPCPPRPPEGPAPAGSPALPARPSVAHRGPVLRA